MTALVAWMLNCESPHRTSANAIVSRSRSVAWNTRVKRPMRSASSAPITHAPISISLACAGPTSSTNRLVSASE